MREWTSSDRIERAIAALADRQHGVVARRQLAASGIGERAIENRLLRRSLIRLHRGVYAVGHRQLRIEGRWLAAVLAAGPGAVLSHRDAAALHGMRAAPESRRVSVTTAANVRAARGLWAFPRRVLAAEERTVVRAIPVTSPARTLVDLAPMLTLGQLQSTLGEADRKGLLDVHAVERALARVKSRHGQGHARLRAALDAHAKHGAVLARSWLEERFLDLVIDARLPRPLLNAPAAGFEVDALWPDERVVVELDGWADHKARAAAARDRDKTNRLQVAGYVVLRFLHGDVVGDPERVASALRDALAQSTSTVSSCE
jgi:predicted transcriptional regulator of viral defense system